MWGAAKLATDAGGWRQVNRADIPMVWPLFRALGGDDDSPDHQHDTTAQPTDDPANDTERAATQLVGGTGWPQDGSMAEPLDSSRPRLPRTGFVALRQDSSDVVDLDVGWAR